MDRKPLIGVSICAVVLLVMASLTNVVGYQSVSSPTVNDSPLFQTRTQRATNQQQNILTSRYLGIGKENLLKFQIQNNKIESYVKAIEYIGKMDEKAFNSFSELVIQHSQQNDILRDMNPNEIIEILNRLRTTSMTLLYSPISTNNYQLNQTLAIPTLSWFPGCFLFIFMVIVIGLFESFALLTYIVLINVFAFIASLLYYLLNYTIYFCPS